MQNVNTTIDMSCINQQKLQNAIFKNCKDIIFYNAPESLKQIKIKRSTINSLDGIQQLNQLDILEIDQNPEICLNPLTTLNITKLSLQNMNLSDISMLRFLKKLTSLDLCSNNIFDISMLSFLQDVTFLRLRKNKIQNISVLSKLTCLKELIICQNLIYDVLPISSLKLEKLYIWGNYITDISCLNTSNMVELFVQQNYIPAQQIAKFKQLSINRSNYQEQRKPSFDLIFKLHFTRFNSRLKQIYVKQETNNQQIKKDIHSIRSEIYENAMKCNLALQRMQSESTDSQ
ncbi:Conserved_hypothetical protein [Hexamita inflata]|uniref:Uncharacterized protein n=1 Tax=Hexamita inflata TaxID=28002 RepID=A0AA86N7A1_9EUKA|nr:Conserved hypothetical protein [Hexamita inflata]CAI9934703.1 Conserved hypothetical protein [Hexamita inflata]